MEQRSGNKSALDVAADVLVFAPVGLAIELSKHLPELARQGRTHLEGPLNAAKFMGNVAASQGRQQFGDKIRQAAEPFFGPSEDEAAPPAPRPTATPKSRPKTDLPIAGYDTLSASQIVAHLASLSPEDLGRIQVHESANRGRKTILSRIDQLLEAS